MDFSLSEKTETMLGMVHEFVDRELVPMEEAFLRKPFRALLPEIEVNTLGNAALYRYYRRAWEAEQGLIPPPENFSPTP